MNEHEVFKFFSYKEKSNWRVNELISMSQIYTMLHALQWKYEVFASTQNYDAQGNVTGSFLFFDFDGNPKEVLADVIKFTQGCEFVINVTPRIYFSGNKGFHLTIEKFITHPRVHELVQDFAFELGSTCATLDRKVYRHRSMFRIPGSPASTPGYFKIEITRDELFTLSFEEIKELATHRRIIENQHDVEKLEIEAFDAWLKIATENLKPYNLETVKNLIQDLDMEITPCITRMLTRPPVRGERHSTVYILARFFALCGIDQEIALNILFSHQHYRDFEAEHREVSKTVRSVYGPKKDHKIGCYGDGQYAELMRSYCSELCHFRLDFKHDRIKFA